MRSAAIVLTLLLVALSACTSVPSGDAPTSSVQPELDKAPTPEASASALVCHSSPPPDGFGPLLLVDETEELGLIHPLVGIHGHAAAVADLDGDALPDFYVGTFGDRDPSAYQSRGATGPRPDQVLLSSGAEVTLVDELGRTSGSAIADFDADGDADLLVIRHAGLGEGSGVPSRIYENTPDGLASFEILPPGFLGRTPAVADFDGDGLLDLYVSEDKYGSTGGILLWNRGDMEFEDVTVAAGVAGLHALGTTAGDLNGDRRPDLVTSRNILVNQGDMTFVDATPGWYEQEAMGPEDDPAGVAIGDLNQDGIADLVLGQHNRMTVEEDQSEPVRVLVGLGPNDLGDPVFEEATDSVGMVALPTLAPHVQIADMNNDGWPDIVTSASADDGTTPAVFINEGSGDLRFAVSGELGSDQYWVGGPVADLNRDGLLDVFALEWEPSLPSIAFINRTPGGHWLELSISGPNQGIGTTVRITDKTGRLLGIQEIGVTTGYSSAHPPVAHFGLGENDQVDIEITLADGQMTTVIDAPIDSQIRWPNGCDAP